MIDAQSIRAKTAQRCMPLVAMLAVGVPSLALGAPVSTSAESATTVSEVAVEVDVASTIDEQERLQSWLENKAGAALNESTPPNGRRGALEIDVTGTLYNYRITITARQDGDVVGVPDTWNCECSNEEVLNAVAARVSTLAGRLDVEEEHEESVLAPAIEDPGDKKQVLERPPVLTKKSEDHYDALRPRRGRLGAMGSTGVAFITLGVLGIGGGAGLIIYHQFPPEPDRAWPKRDLTDYQTLGIITASSSAGVLVTGALLVGFRNRRPKKKLGAMVIAPAFGRKGTASLTFSGRF